MKLHINTNKTKFVVSRKGVFLLGMRNGLMVTSNRKLLKTKQQKRKTTKKKKNTTKNRHYLAFNITTKISCKQGTEQLVANREKRLCARTKISNIQGNDIGNLQNI